MTTTGSDCTCKGTEAFEEQLVLLFVYIKVTKPALSPVTTPESVIVATTGLLLLHVPSDEGVNVVVSPTQIGFKPVKFTTGFGFTKTGIDASELQPKTFSVKIKEDVPGLSPVTRPVDEICATDGLVLTQKPPVEGVI